MDATSSRLLPQSGAQNRPQRSIRAASRLWAIASIVAAVATGLTACRSTASTQAKIAALDQALPSPHIELARGVVARPDDIAPLIRPLGERMGLLVIHSAKEWEKVAAAAPALRDHAPPDFGCVVCLISWAGTPLSGKFPMSVRTIFVADGAAAVVADFEPGTYLPDAATYITAILAPGVREVLEVDVSGTRFSLAGE